MLVVYFSNVSENTHRFVQKLEQPALRLPVRAGDVSPQVTEPYVLILPTYGGGRDHRAGPKPVIEFLNAEAIPNFLRGVVACGNTNFGPAYCIAGDIVATKCDVPVLHRLEIFGLPEDVLAVETAIEKLTETEPVTS